MKTRRSIAIAVTALIIVGLVVALKLSAAQDLGADDDTGAQVVAAVPAESVTEYEPDPFEPERLRSSTVRVRRVAVVYADGSIEIKPCE